MSTLSEVRFGVIGYGNMGRYHAKNLSTGVIPGARLTAVCDEKSGGEVKIDGVKGFTSIAEFFDSGLFDAVLIATPHFSHTTLGIEALKRGLHTLVEKPLSVHKKDAERLIAAHTDPKVVFAAMFNQRPDPRYKKVRDLLRSGELGELRRVNWIITNWFRTESYYASGGWRATWKGEGGGVLLNQCPHQLDLLTWICGMPTTVRGFCKLGKYHDIEVDDDVTAYLEFANGATGVFITTTGEAPGTNRLEVTGDRGKIVVEDGKLRFTRNESPMHEFSQKATGGFDKPDVWNIDIPVDGDGGQHVTITRNFVNAILKGEELLSPAREGIHSVELANAILYSSLEDRTVQLPLDSDAYEAKLNHLIATSRHVKKVREQVTGDMSKTF